MVGPSKGPGRGKIGEKKFGFTVDEKVIVTEEGAFKDWPGLVLSFSEDSVAVELWDPEKEYARNGQWFSPEQIKSSDW